MALPRWLAKTCTAVLHVFNRGSIKKRLLDSGNLLHVLLYQVPIGTYMLGTFFKGILSQVRARRMMVGCIDVIEALKSKKKKEALERGHRILNADDPGAPSKDEKCVGCNCNLQYLISIIDVLPVGRTATVPDALPVSSLPVVGLPIVPVVIPLAVLPIGAHTCGSASLVGIITRTVGTITSDSVRLVTPLRARARPRLSVRGLRRAKHAHSANCPIPFYFSV